MEGDRIEFEKMSSSKLPDRLVITAGTYDGVLAGWDTVKPTHHSKNSKDAHNGSQDLLQMLNSASPQDENAYLHMTFAMVVHEGSVRCLSLASAPNQNSEKDGHDKKNPVQDGKGMAEHNHHPTIPGTLLSGGFDESLAIFSLKKYAQIGELKTPSNLGTPSCSSFAPPGDPSPSHVLVGLSSGKIVIYKRKDMSIQHILPGHDDKGVSCIAVHPSGKMALSGGRDGKLCLWDLMRGRLAYINKLPNPSKGRKATINHIVWSEDGQRYAFCTHEGNIQAREMETGQTLLDIQMHPGGRANQICFIGSNEGLLLAAACNDGGLPVFAVGCVNENEEETGTRRAIMAIEPVEGAATAGDERFKCIQSVKGGSGFLVVTANSGGIVSLIDLEGAANMMAVDDDEDGDDGKDLDTESSDNSQIEDESGSDSEDDEELAADIISSVRLGTGARITCISVWSCFTDSTFSERIDSQPVVSKAKNDDFVNKSDEIVEDETFSKKRKRKEKAFEKSQPTEIELDEEALQRARTLVNEAKKIKNRKKKNKK
jgi:FOG: WD40 repeat